MRSPMTTSAVYTSTEDVESSREKVERLVIPVLPLRVAIVCCVLNFLVPGLGSICAGIGAFCCSQPEVLESKSEKWVSCLSGLGIGLAQLITTACLIGLFWSWGWGIYLIYQSRAYGESQDARHYRTYNPTYGRGDEMIVIVTGQPFIIGNQNGTPRQPFVTGNQTGIAETSFVTSSVPSANQRQFSPYQNGSGVHSNQTVSNGGDNISVDTDYVDRVRLP